MMCPFGAADRERGRKMDLTNVMNCMGTLFLLIAVGFVCNKVGILHEEAKRSLSRLVINVAMSAMTIDSIVNTDVSLTGSTVAELIEAIAVYYGALFLLGLAFSFLVAPRRKERGLYHFMTLFGNIGFLGYPLVTALFGEGALFYVALFNIPFNLLLYTYGVVLVRGKEQGRAEGSFWKSMLNAPAVASVAAIVLLLLGVKLPTAIADALSYIGDMTIPGAMLVVGASLAAVPMGPVWKEWRLYALSAVVLLVRPVVVWVLLRLFIQDPVILGVSVMLAATPVAANTTALCIEYRADEALASGGVFLTTLLSLATIPIVAMLL